LPWPVDPAKQVPCEKSVIALSRVGTFHYNGIPSSNSGVFLEKRRGSS
jgi:hypothetical protein